MIGCLSKRLAVTTARGSVQHRPDVQGSATSVIVPDKPSYSALPLTLPALPASPDSAKSTRPLYKYKRTPHPAAVGVDVHSLWPCRHAEVSGSISIYHSPPIRSLGF